MKNRLLEKTKTAKKNRRKLFCAFLTLGYPSLKATEELILAFEKIGVDIIELGIPFSDPLADGPTIQYSSEYALSKGIKLEDAFKLVQKLRKRGCQIPIICFTYLNPVYQYGVRHFPHQAKQSGFDGLIIPDLPPEAEKTLAQGCKKSGLSQIFLIAPTTDSKRVLSIDRKSQGFVYYVSLRGVTGARKSLAAQVRRDLKKIRSKVRQPLLVGFGVSSPVQAKELSRLSQGVIVGSAIIDRIRRSGDKIKDVIPFIRQMVKAVKNGQG